MLDTGFDHTHQDFVGRIITKKLFASNSAEDDVHGHGTHCIGTACGPLRPTTGPRYGIAYESQIYAGKVLGDDGFGTDRSIIAGMDWALDEGCQIISMSLGAATQTWRPAQRRLRADREGLSGCGHTGGRCGGQ